MLDVKSAGETFAREQEEDSLSDVRSSAGGVEACKQGGGRVATLKS